MLYFKIGFMILYNLTKIDLFWYVFEKLHQNIKCLFEREEKNRPNGREERVTYVKWMKIEVVCLKK